MNFAAPQPYGQGRGRIVFGVAVSLGVHALLLFAYRHVAVLPADPLPEAPASIAVWVRPPPPPPRSEPAPQPEPVRRPDPTPAPKRAERPPQDTPPPPRVIAVPPVPAQDESADPFVVEQAPTPQEPEPAPRFDMDAARQAARRFANVPDPARADTPVGQIPPPPLQTESKAARAISQAKRPDCKDGLPGGLLGPLIILMDKKDHGCKW